jgi:hypothetical protein
MLFLTVRKRPCRPQSKAALRVFTVVVFQKHEEDVNTNVIIMPKDGYRCPTTKNKISEIMFVHLWP